jgi:hypothetical protein
MTKLTESQRKALLWLPRNGSERLAKRVGIQRLGAFFALRDAGLVRFRTCNVVAALFGAGFYRLTRAGIAARKELEKGDG